MVLTTTLNTETIVKSHNLLLTSHMDKHMKLLLAFYKRENLPTYLEHAVKRKEVSNPTIQFVQCFR